MDTETEENKQLELDKAHNVMNIDLVLAKIGRNLSVKDALELRHTCWRWNCNFGIALKRLHKPIQLQMVKYLPKPWGALEMRRKIADYLNVIRSSNNHGILFTKYTIGPGLRDDPNDNHLEQVQHFISTNGTQINSLGLDVGTQFPPQLLWMIIMEWTPQLEELYLKLSRGWDRDEWVATQEKPTTTLKKLAVEFEGKYSDSDREPFLEVMRFSPQLHSLKFNLSDNMQGQLISEALLNRRVDNLKSLKMARRLAGPWVPELTTLADLGRQSKHPLRLRAVCLTYRAVYHVDESVARRLQGFLCTQAPSLEKLKLDFIGSNGCRYTTWNTGGVVWLPRLKQLKTLQLSRQQLNQPEFHYESTDFANTFPALRRLSYRHHYENGSQTDAAAVSSDIERLDHPMVSELELETFPGHVLLFAARFPSVTKLQLTLHSANYRNSEIDWAVLIWASWSMLTSLEVGIAVQSLMNGVQLDDLLSGVEVLNFNEVNRQLDSMMEPTLNILCDLRAKYKTRPGLTDLKHLQKLHLRVLGGRRAKLEDVGGYLGLACAMGVEGSPLQYVEISGNVSTSISEKCEAYLRSLLPIHGVLNLPNWEFKSRKRKLSST